MTTAGEVEALARPGDGHVGDSELLVNTGLPDQLDFVRRRRGRGTRVRQEPLLNPDDEHDRPLTAFRTMDCRQQNAIGVVGR